MLAEEVSATYIQQWNILHSVHAPDCEGIPVIGGKVFFCHKVIIKIPSLVIWEIFFMLSAMCTRVSSQENLRAILHTCNLFKILCSDQLIHLKKYHRAERLQGLRAEAS
jgi:hypothetical protein